MSVDFRPFSAFNNGVSAALAMNVVRAKPVQHASSRVVAFLKYALPTLAIVTLAGFGYEAKSGYLGLLSQHFETTSIPGGRLIKVPPGGNVRSAILQAVGGDIIELQAGAVYSGQIDLPNKPLTDYVTIRSSGVSELADGKRVSPSQKGSMAVIQSGMLGRAAVSATDGAHHYRFVGIEFQATGTLFNYGVVVLGGKETTVNKVPHDIEIDRCYIHPTGKTISRRGIALNSANTVIKNSYIEGFAGVEQETQGICGWSGTRDVKINNNYIEGGAENIMFGGADPADAELIPKDIEIRGNDLNKPAEWNNRFTVKTLFEIKNAKNVTFAANQLTNNWKGSAFRITVRNQDGGSPFATIEDVVIKDNIIDGAGEAINILGSDNDYPSQTLRRLTITNNLFLNIVGDANGFEGSGYFVQIADGNGVSITRNTVFNAGNIVTFYGTMPRGFVFRDNILSIGRYGIHGPLDPKGDEARQMFSGNVFMNLGRVSNEDYTVPAGGGVVVGGVGDVGFLDVGRGDYRLAPSSRFYGKAGSDLFDLPKK